MNDDPADLIAVLLAALLWAAFFVAWWWFIAIVFGWSDLWQMPR